MCARTRAQLSGNTADRPLWRSFVGNHPELTVNEACELLVVLLCICNCVVITENNEALIGLHKWTKTKRKKMRNLGKAYLAHFAHTQYKMEKRFFLFIYYKHNQTQPCFFP